LRLALHHQRGDQCEVGVDDRGDPPTDGPEDPYQLAARANRKKFPAIRIDCGVEDPFIEQNRAFHKHLEALDIAHEYEEATGTHCWRYWDHHVQTAIDFHRRHLGIPDDPEHALLR